MAVLLMLAILLIVPNKPHARFPAPSQGMASVQKEKSLAALTSNVSYIVYHMHASGK